MNILEFIPHSPLSMGLVDLDYTFVVELGVFLLLMIALNKLLFEPLQRNLDHRRASISGARAEAESMSLEAQQLVEQRRESVDQARDRAYSAINEMKNEGQAREQEILKAAHQRVDEQVKKGRAELQEALTKSRRETENESDVLATLIVEKLLDRT
ncbi:MAG: ATP synthase F0 subunit B [Myxococcales bacterium]|nr:ATP synthase F0 subunit B [Myxococcales bacterium]